MINFLRRATLILPLLFISTLFAETRIDTIISKMSLEEKIGQMILVYNSPLSFLKKYKIGGVLIMQNMLKNPDKLKRNILQCQNELKIPLLISIDQEGGTVNRMSFMEKWKNVPSAKKLSYWSIDSIVTYQKGIAKDLSLLGVNLNLAPVLDPDTNYQNVETHIGIEERSFGHGTEKVLPVALAYSSAFLEYGIGSVIKHFPGYNITENSDKKISISYADSNSINNNMKIFVDFGDTASGIMMSSVLYKNYCNRPAVFCSKIVEKARAISPSAIVMTDDLWGTAVRSFTYPGHKITNINYPDTAFQRIVELAVLAGNDMLMVTYPQKVPLIISRIEKLVDGNSDVLDHINQSVFRILIQKKRLGIIK